MEEIKFPSVAGQFYPAAGQELSSMIKDMLTKLRLSAGDSQPKAMIVPHAGLIYSGQVAAKAYKILEVMPQIKTVILLGPSHFLGFSGIAFSTAKYFRTPLGDIPVNLIALEKIKNLIQVNPIDQAFHREHCLEVQLPFLQTLLPEFSIVPLLVGLANKAIVAEVLQALWGDSSTLILISSDLSHYHDYATARQLDAQTTTAIENLEADAILDDRACGRYPLRGLLHLAKMKNMRIKTLAVCNSGDTCGDKTRVVGYGAFHLYL